MVSAGKDFMDGTAKPFTPKQGQYLAFIYAYMQLNRRPPAEADVQRYFQVSPPSVHQMLLTLERRGLIRRQPGTARSIELLVDPETLPTLGAVISVGRGTSFRSER
jgi:repressor LexA